MDALLRFMRTRTGMISTLAILAGLIYMVSLLVSGGLFRSSLLGDTPPIGTDGSQIRYYRSYEFAADAGMTPTSQLWERTSKVLTEKTPSGDTGYRITTTTNATGGSSERIFRDWNVAPTDNMDIEVQLAVLKNPCNVQGGAYLTFSNGDHQGYALFCENKIFIGNGDQAHAFNSQFAVASGTLSTDTLNLKEKNTFLIRVTNNKDIEVLQKQNQAYVSLKKFPNAFVYNAFGSNRIEFGVDVPGDADLQSDVQWFNVAAKIYPQDQSKMILTYDASKGTAPIKQGWNTADTTSAASGGAYPIQAKTYAMDWHATSNDKIDISMQYSATKPCGSYDKNAYPYWYGGIIQETINQPTVGGISFYELGALPKLEISNGNKKATLYFCSDKYLLVSDLSSPTEIAGLWHQALFQSYSTNGQTYNVFKISKQFQHNIRAFSEFTSAPNSIRIQIQNRVMQLSQSGTVFATLPLSFQEQTDENSLVFSTGGKDFTISSLTAELSPQEQELDAYFRQNPTMRKFFRSYTYSPTTGLPITASFTKNVVSNATEAVVTDANEQVLETSAPASTNASVYESYPWNVSPNDIIDLEITAKVLYSGCSFTKSNSVSFSNGERKGFITLCKDKIYLSNGSDLPYTQTQFIDPAYNATKKDIDMSGSYKTLYIRIQGTKVQVYQDAAMSQLLIESAQGFALELNSAKENALTFGSQSIEQFPSPHSIRWKNIHAKVYPAEATVSQATFSYNPSISGKALPREQGWINTPGLLGSINGGRYQPLATEENKVFWNANSKDTLDVQFEVLASDPCPIFENDKDSFATMIQNLPYIRISTNSGEARLSFCNNQTWFTSPESDADFEYPTTAKYFTRVCYWWGCGDEWRDFNTVGYSYYDNLGYMSQNNILGQKYKLRANNGDIQIINPDTGTILANVTGALRMSKSNTSEPAVVAFGGTKPALWKDVTATITQRIPKPAGMIELVINLLQKDMTMGTKTPISGEDENNRYSLTWNNIQNIPDRIPVYFCYALEGSAAETCVATVKSGTTYSVADTAIPVDSRSLLQQISQTSPTTACFTTSAQKENGIAGAWSADESYSDAINGVTFSPNGMTFDIGKNGKSFLFNGSGYLQAQDNAAFIATNGLSISTWINKTSSSNNAAIFERGDGNTSGGYGLYNSGSGGLTFKMKLSSGWKTFGTSGWSPNTWEHVTVTYDGSSVKTYRNGTLIDTQAATGAIVSPTSPKLRMGKTFGSTSNYFKGKVDELKVYTVALSQEQITKLYNESTTAGSQTTTCVSSSTQNPSTVSYRWSLKADIDKKSTGNEGVLRSTYRPETYMKVDTTGAPFEQNSTITINGTSATLAGKILAPYTGITHICLSLQKNDGTYEAEQCRSGADQLTPIFTPTSNTIQTTFTGLTEGAKYRATYKVTRNDSVTNLVENAQILTIPQLADLKTDIILFPNENKPQVFIVEKEPVPVPASELPENMTYTRMKDATGKEVLSWKQTWKQGTYTQQMTDGSTQQATYAGVPEDSILWLCISNSDDWNFQQKKCTKLTRNTAFEYTATTDENILPLTISGKYIWRVEQEPNREVLHKIADGSVVEIVYNPPIDPVAAAQPSFNIIISDITKDSAKLTVEAIKYPTLSSINYSYTSEGVDNPGTISGFTTTTRTAQGSITTYVHTTTVSPLLANTLYTLTKINLRNEANVLVPVTLDGKTFTTLPVTPTPVTSTRTVPTSGGTSLSTGADIISPNVTMAGITNGATYTTIPSISGTASDNVEISSVGIILKNSDGQYLQANGTFAATANTLPAIFTATTGAWSYSIPTNGLINKTSYTVKAEATDSATLTGATAEYAFTYDTTFSDTQKPTVTISELIQGQSVRTFSGVTLQATDNTMLDVVSVSIKDTTTNQYLGTNNTLTSPTLVKLPLSKVATGYTRDISSAQFINGHALEITGYASDLYGNSSDITTEAQKTIIFDASLPADSSAPTVTFTNVTNGAKNNFATFSGTAFDLPSYGMVSSGALSIKSAANNMYFDPATNGFTSTTEKMLPLPFTQTATTSTEGSKIYTWSYTPSQNLLVNDTSYVVQAYATDASGKTGTTGPLTITQYIAPQDAQAPVVTITTPNQNAETSSHVVSGTTSDDLTMVQNMTYTLKNVTTGQFYDGTLNAYTATGSILPIAKVNGSYNSWNVLLVNSSLEGDKVYAVAITATDGSGKNTTSTVNFTYKSVTTGSTTTNTGNTGTTTGSTSTPSTQITTALRTITADVTLTTQAVLPAGAMLPVGTILPNTTTPLTAPLTTTSQLTFGTGAVLKSGTIFPIGTVLPVSITLGTIGSSAGTTTGTGTTTSSSNTSTSTTSSATTLPATSTGTTSTGSTATSTGQTMTGSTMTGTLLQTAVVKDNGTSISFPIAFKAVSFAKDTTSASIVATIEPTQKLPAGVPLKICYQKTASLAQALCVTATQNANGTFTAKLPLRSDEAGTYNWVLAMGDVPLSTYGTLEVKVTNGVSSLTNTMLKNDPVATVTVPKNQLLTATLAPVDTAKPATVQVSLSVEKVTWSTFNKMMAAEVTMKDALHEKLPVGVCYIEKTANAKPACTSLGKSGALTYTGTTLIVADKPATYGWIITVADTPLNVEGTLTVSQKNGIFEAVATTDKNMPTTLAIETALLGTLKPVIQTMTGTSTGSTLTCPPTCIGQSSLVPDVPVDHFAFTPISKLLSRGIMSGYADGTFRPALAINRAEFTKLTKNTFLIPTLDKTAALSFSDITANAWFYNYVRSLSQVGLIKGYSDGTFRAGNNILRSEAAKIIALAHRMQTVLNANPKLTFTDALEKADMDITASFLAFTNENPTYTYALLQDVPVNSWYAKYVYYAVRNDLIKGRDTAGGRVFAPGAQILRGEAATLLSRVIETLDIKYPMNKDAAGVVTAAFPE